MLTRSSLCDNDLGMLMSVLQYNLNQQQTIEKEKSPVLALSVDDLFDLCLSGNDMEVLNDVLKGMEEHDKKCHDYLLSVNTLMVLATRLLDFCSQSYHSFIPSLLLMTLFQIPSKSCE